MTHLQYLVRYAKLSHTDKSHRKKHLAVVTKGLRFWEVRRPVARNKWFNGIGAPRVIRDILILSHGGIPVELEQAMVAIMGANNVRGTAANLVWTAELMFHS